MVISCARGHVATWKKSYQGQLDWNGEICRSVLGWGIAGGSVGTVLIPAGVLVSGPVSRASKWCQLTLWSPEDLLPLQYMLLD